MKLTLKLIEVIERMDFCKTKLRCNASITDNRLLNYILRQSSLFALLLKSKANTKGFFRNIL